MREQVKSYRFWRRIGLPKFPHRTNGAVTVQGDPIFPIAAVAKRAIRTGEGEVPEYSIRDVPFIPEGTPAPMTPSSIKARSVCITANGSKSLILARTPPSVEKRFAALVESDKEEEKAKKAAEEEVKKSRKTPEAAATRAAKALNRST